MRSVCGAIPIIIIRIHPHQQAGYGGGGEGGTPLIGDTTRGGNAGVQSDRGGCDIRGSGDVDHWGSNGDEVPDVRIGGVAGSGHRIDRFEAEEIAGARSQAGEIVGKSSQTLGPQAGIGRPARISGSTVGGVVVEGDGGLVAARSVVGEHLAVHRNRSGSHGSGGLGDHRGLTNRGSGGEGEGIRPTRSRGIGPLESGMVGGAGSQIIEGECDRTRGVGTCQGNVGIPGCLGEVGVGASVKDCDRRIGSPGVGQVVGTDGGVTANGAHVVGSVAIVQEDRHVGCYPDGDHLRVGRARKVGGADGDVMISDGACPPLDLACRIDG